MQIEKVLWQLPLLTVSWSLKLQLEDNEKKKSKKMTLGHSEGSGRMVGEEWMNVPCGHECVLDVTLERIKLRGRVSLELTKDHAHNTKLLSTETVCVLFMY